MKSQSNFYLTKTDIFTGTYQLDKLNYIDEN